MRLKSLTALLLAAAIPLLILIGCDDNPTGDTLAEAQRATVMFVNGSPMQNPVDVRIDGVRQAEDLIFPNNTGYQPVSAGEHTISVTYAQQPSPVLDSLVANLSGLKVYSVFVGDTGAATSVLLLTDEIATPDTNHISIRVVNLSPNAGTIDIREAQADSILADMQNVSFLGATSFHSAKADRYLLEVAPSGTSNSLVTAPAMNFEAGRVYTIYITGYVGGFDEEALTVRTIMNQ